MNAVPSVTLPLGVTPAAPVIAVAPPPYSLEPVTFRLPALAEAAASAQLGGDREMAIGSFLVARLMLATMPPMQLPTMERATRAERARQWLSSLAMPQPARMALLRAADASVAGGRDAAASLRELAQMLLGHLAPAALQELVALGDHLRLYYDQNP